MFAFSGSAQKVTIEGNATDSTKGVYVIEIVINDTLSKLMDKNPKEGKTKYLKIYQNPKYVVRTDSTGTFKINANVNDSLFFKSYEHKTQKYLVKDLIARKNIKIVLVKAP